MSAPAGFVLRAPWYARERHGWTVNSPAAARPQIQMYDSTTFVRRLLADPRDSDKVGADDYWSYPVPVTPSPLARGRDRLATHRLVQTGLRKLYQPSHNRYYVVVVEVFCDQPGLPRAGSHPDIEVKMVLRRQHTTVTGNPRPVRTLARALVKEMAAEQYPGSDPDLRAGDLHDLLWAQEAWHRDFAANHADLFTEVTAQSDDQAWMVGPDGGGGRWRTLGDKPRKDDPPWHEQEIAMSRIPARAADCDAARTRSLWFGIVPTSSGEHWTDPATGRPEPKLDDRAIYTVQCLVRQPLPPGHEHCPPREWWSAPSESFRLAAPADPDGTKNRLVSITLPDLRRLAARAGKPQGPGGVRITTPPGSQLVFKPFGGVPTTGSIGPGGGVCTFSLELFFIVAFFLFMLFLPIVVLIFQLWWLLALRFCIPPSLGFSVVSAFFANGKLLADLPKSEIQGGLGSVGEEYLEAALGAPGWYDQLTNAKDEHGNGVFTNDPDLVNAVVVVRSADGALVPGPLPLDTKPDDPLCPTP